MTLPNINTTNTVFANSNKNLLITSDLTTGNILFTSGRHNIPPQVLGKLVAEEDPRSEDDRPRIRIKRVNADGSLDRYLLRKKLTWRFFCLTDGTQTPSRITTASTRAQSVTEVVDYLNNVFTETQSNTAATIDFGPSDSLDCQRDSTNNTVLFNNGRAYAVNAIKAIENNSGLINVVDHASQQIYFRDIRHNLVTITSNAAGSTAAAVVNAMNALFTVNPVGDGYLPVGSKTTLASEATTINKVDHTTPTTTDPNNNAHIIVASGVGDGLHHSRAYTNEYIDEAGEYIDFQITGRGDFFLGTYRIGTDESALASGTTGNLNSGAYWGIKFVNNSSTGVTPNSSFGSNNGMVFGSGWTGASSEQYGTNGVIQSNHTNFLSNLLRLSIDSAGYVALSYYDEGRTNEFILIARSSAVPASGVQLGFLIKCISDTATLAAIPDRTAVDPTSPTLVYRYIESPDGDFYFPLFATSTEANYVDTQNGGSGTSNQHIFVDEPTGTTWYMPATGGTTAGSSAPSNPPGFTYTEIPTEADNLHGPSTIVLNDIVTTENAAVNTQIIPAGATYTTTVTGLPTGVSYANGYITGTTRYVSEDTDYTVTVDRTNAYATTSQTFTLTIQHNETLANLPNWTEVRTDSIQIQTDFVLHYSPEAVYDFYLPLRKGDEFTWTQTNMQGSTGEGGIGQHAQFGIVSSGVNKTTATLGNNTSNWDLKLKISTDTLNPSQAVGWVSNAQISTGSNDNVVWKLAYESNDEIALYRAGTEVARSSSTFSGDQTITLAVPAAYSVSTRLPGFVRSLIGAGSTTPPTGFNAPLLHGTMAGTTQLGPTPDPAVVQLTETLRVNHRFLIPQTWVEANILPLTCDGDPDQKAIIGAPTPGTTWSTTQQVQDFDASLRINSNANSHQSKLYTRGNDPENNNLTVNSLTDAYYDYALEWDGEGLYMLADTLTNLTTKPGVREGYKFNRMASYPDYSTSRSISNDFLDLVIAAKNGGAVTLSTTGLSQIRIPFDTRDVLVGENSNGTGDMSYPATASEYDDVPSGHTPAAFTFADLTTLQKGYTYRFIYHPSMEANDYWHFKNGSTAYTEGITAFDNTVSGDPSTYSSTKTDGYKGFTFEVPLDAPSPLTLYYFNSNTSTDDAGRSITIGASTDLTTDWNKAVDFSGTSERMTQGTNTDVYEPLRMDNKSVAVSAPNSAGSTSSDSNARPWAVSCVFLIEGNNSDQWIWAQGEGVGSNDDVIGIRVDGSRNVYFRWGRGSSFNELWLGQKTANQWYGLYVAHTGERLTAANASHGNLADCFDIRFVNLTTAAVGSNESSALGWANSFDSTTGGDMTYTQDGAFYVGGIAGQQNLFGKLASCVVTTLRRGQPMPSDEEISMMVRDPIEWAGTYKQGKDFRLPDSDADTVDFTLSGVDECKATQIWLMGDTSDDAYPDIKNYVRTVNDDTKLVMTNMVSADIETVNISGLT